MSTPPIPTALPALPPDGGILLVDKRSGPTSHDVVGRCRRLLGTRRVGHAGTLDPMATGLLVIACERSTKLLGHLALTAKSYTATIRLGVATDTDDADGTPVATAPPGAVAGLGEDAVRAGVAALTGDLLQRPSSVSAIKVDGRRAYERHRAGEEIELAARPVTVSRFALVAPPRRGQVAGAEVLDLDVEVDCTTGTYIRALARDLGAALGVGGHLTALRRTAVGPFRVDGAVDVGTRDDPVEDLAGAVRAAVLPAADAVRLAFTTRTADEAEQRALSHGRPLAAQGTPGTVAVLSPAGDQLLALVREQDNAARPVVVFAAR